MCFTRATAIALEAHRYNERVIEGTVRSDSGAMLRDVINRWQAVG